MSLAGNEERKPGFLQYLVGVVELLVLDSCETSPVWMMKSGWIGSALTFAIASRKVARASALGGLLKPMWLSLSCRKVNACAAAVPRNGAAKAASNPREAGTPEFRANKAPVPAHAMHFKKSRRSFSVSLAGMASTFV
jgi:hypothetical protein